MYCQDRSHWKNDHIYITTYENKTRTILHTEAFCRICDISKIQAIEKERDTRAIEQTTKGNIVLILFIPLS